MQGQGAGWVGRVSVGQWGKAGRRGRALGGWVGSVGQRVRVGYRGEARAWRQGGSVEADVQSHSEMCARTHAHVCMHTHTHAHMHACTHARTRPPHPPHTCACTHTHTHNLHMHAQMQPHLYAVMELDLDVHAHMQPGLHACAHSQDCTP